MSISIHEDLRHRGEPLVAYPCADLWKAVGGSDGVVALIQDLYRRIEQDELLRDRSGKTAAEIGRAHGGIVRLLRK